MYTLSSETLDVSILDPVADQERFGPRYCTGGYIFQVEDRRHGPLLSGPTFPHDFNWFDGQGIPDAFNLGPLREPASTEPTALIIGVGVCDQQANKVVDYCTWDVQQEGASITMRTTQSFERFALELERSVTLHNRTVRSTTRLKCTGIIPIAIRWFPHPFFPHPETDELCRFNIPVGMPARFAVMSLHQVVTSSAKAGPGRKATSRAWTTVPRRISSYSNGTRSLD